MVLQVIIAVPNMKTVVFESHQKVITDNVGVIKSHQSRQKVIRKSSKSSKSHHRSLRREPQWFCKSSSPFQIGKGLSSKVIKKSSHTKEANCRNARGLQTTKDAYCRNALGFQTTEEANCRNAPGLQATKERLFVTRLASRRQKEPIVVAHLASRRQKGQLS